jgi:hypothetical protein
MVYVRVVKALVFGRYTLELKAVTTPCAWKGLRAGLRLGQASQNL